MRSRTVLAAILTSVLLGTLLPATPSRAETSNVVPEALREPLRRPLDRRVRALLAQTDDAGIKNVRGSYLDRFLRVDDATYHVVFHTRTAEPEDLVVRRSLLTLARGTGDDWSIVDERVEREVRGILVRGRPGDETFHAFDRFRFEAEGLVAESGPGSLYVDYIGGSPRQIVLRGAGLAYRYRPPEDVDGAVTYSVFEQRHGDAVVFEPREVRISCAAGECYRILGAAFDGLRNATRDELDPDLGEAYDKAIRELEKDRSDDPLSGFSRTPRQGHDWWSVALEKTGGGQTIWLIYDSLARSAVRFAVEGRGTICAYPSAAERASGADPVVLERRADVDRLDYDLEALHGEVELALDDAGTIHADLSYRLRLLQPVQMLYFDISNIRGFRDERKDTKDPALRLERIEDGAGEELTFVKTGSTTGWILPAEPLDTGDTLELRIVYTHENAIYQLNRHYSYVSRSGWLPFVNFGDFIDDYDLTVHVPKRYEVLGVGSVASNEIRGERRTARFTGTSPVQFPTVIFGEYYSDRSKIEVTKSDGSKVPVRIYVDEFSMSSAGFAIRPGQLRPKADEAANALNLYQAILGVDYPHEKLDLVNAVFQNPFSGQSPASIVYLGGAVFRGTGTLAAFSRNSGGTTKFIESLVAHEVGHQWWGGATAHASWGHYWFVESLAEYMAALFVENLHAARDPAAGWSHYKDKVEGWRREILAADLTTSVQNADSTWSGEIPGLARRALIYAYGPYAFHMLRMTFRDYDGNAGDQRFFRFLGDLARETRGREITTREIQRIAEWSLGGTDPAGVPRKVGLEWFFDQWIRGVGIPELRYEWSSRRAEDGTFIIQGTIRQRVLIGKDRIEAPGIHRGLAVLQAESGKERYTVPVPLNGAETPFVFKVPRKPSRLVLNPNGEMLSHDVIETRL